MSDKVQWSPRGDGGYYSSNRLIEYRDRNVPAFFVRGNPYGKGYVIFKFSTDIGEYVRNDIIQEMRGITKPIIFPRLSDAKDFVDILTKQPHWWV